LGAVAASVFIFGLPFVVLVIYVVMCLITFVAYAWDKTAAQRGRWRTPEYVLHLWSLFGGGPGALVAQRLFHHKNRKIAFQVVFWFTALVNCGALVWVLGAGV
jgi:uncharacterized membrane protein YsdA (DUF1294 family)